MSGSIGRRNTGVKISLLGFQIARSHVVVRLADEPLCSDGLANGPTSRCPLESTVSAGHWCSRSTRCEPTAEERGAVNPHATFFGTRGRATAPDDPHVP